MRLTTLAGGDFVSAEASGCFVEFDAPHQLTAAGARELARQLVEAAGQLERTNDATRVTRAELSPSRLQALLLRANEGALSIGHACANKGHTRPCPAAPPPPTPPTPPASCLGSGRRRTA